MPSIDDEYVTYCILGKATEQRGKFFYWPQWEQCFRVLDDLLKGYDRAKIWTCFSAALNFPAKSFKSDPPGTWRVRSETLRFGRQKWTHDDNKRCSLLLDQEYADLTEVRLASSKPKVGAPDIFLLGHHCHIYPDGAWNQVFALSISLERVKQYPEGELETNVQKLGVVLCAARIARTFRRWLISEKRDGVTYVDDIPWMRCSGQYKSLELDARHAWQDVV